MITVIITFQVEGKDFMNNEKISYTTLNKFDWSESDFAKYEQSSDEIKKQMLTKYNFIREYKDRFKIMYNATTLEKYRLFNLEE